MAITYYPLTARERTLIGDALKMAADQIASEARTGYMGEQRRDMDKDAADMLALAERLPPPPS